MKIELRENETGALVRAATGRVLALTFGSHVWLDTEKSPWALPIVYRLRGITFEEGAGI